MIIFVPEINLINLPLFAIISLFCTVRAYCISPVLASLKGRIEILELDKYFDWEECSVIKSSAVESWGSYLMRFPESEWQLRINGHDLNLSLKSKQDIQKEFEKLVFLKKLADQCPDAQKTYIVDSLVSDYLRGICPKDNLFTYQSLRLLSVVNIFIEKIYYYGANLFVLSKVLYQFAYGLMFNKNIDHGFKYIYDGISPRELSVDRDKVTFSWLVDGQAIHGRDILFVAPKADFQMKSAAKKRTKDEDLFVVRDYALLTVASYGRLSAHLARLVLSLFNILFTFSLKGLLRARYSLHIFRWLPLLESANPRAYIITSSYIGSENPISIYFNKIGIKTIVWFYGTNSYLFLTKENHHAFRNVIFCNTIASSVVVWNRHFEEYYRGHPQQGESEVKVIGPLMSGEESVMRLDRKTLSNKYNLKYDKSKKYISIFDSPPVAYSFRPSSQFVPDPNTAEYNRAFMGDMYKLFTNSANISLLYKPKRSLVSGKFHYDDELRNMLGRMEKDPRFVSFDYNINPWVVIALSDICISMPFESPTIAAIHYGKIGLFHDPLNIAVYHRYEGFKEIVTHGYDAMKLLVDSCFNEGIGIDGMLDRGRLSILQGAAPGDNSSDRFRAYINSV